MLYKEIGGEEVINKLVDDFYEIMRTDPFAKECLATHQGKDLKGSGTKLKFFLSGWLGGPQLYLEAFGHPRLRMRHNPFPFGEKEGEQWLYCMRRALAQSSIDPKYQKQMMEAFAGIVEMLTKNRV